MDKQNQEKSDFFTDLGFISALLLIIPYFITIKYFFFWGIKEIPLPNEMIFFLIQFLIKKFDHCFLDLLFIFLTFIILVQTLIFIKKSNHFKLPPNEFVNLFFKENFHCFYFLEIVSILSIIYPTMFIIISLSTIAIYCSFKFTHDLYRLLFMITIPFYIIGKLLIMTYLWGDSFENFLDPLVTCIYFAFLTGFFIGTIHPRSAKNFARFLRREGRYIFIKTKNNIKKRNKTSPSDNIIRFINFSAFITILQLSSTVNVESMTSDSKQINKFPEFINKDNQSLFLIWSSDNKNIFFSCDNGGQIYVKKSEQDLNYNYSANVDAKKSLCNEQ